MHYLKVNFLFKSERFVVFNSFFGYHIVNINYYLFFSIHIMNIVLKFCVVRFGEKGRITFSFFQREKNMMIENNTVPS